MVMANFFQKSYAYYFSSDRCAETEDDGMSYASSSYASYAPASYGSRRFLSGGGDDGGHGDDDGGSHGVCHEERFLLSDCPMFGHQVGCRPPPVSRCA